MIWDSYPVEREGHLHHVAWCVDYFESAPDRTRPIRIDVALTVRDPGPDGLPGDAEREALKALRDALEHDMAADIDARYAVRTTGAGRQVHSFYAPRHKGFFRKKATPKVAADLAAALAGEFPDHPLTVSHAEDEDWQLFLDAFPSTDAVQWFADARAVSDLVRAGDDLAGPRPVAHWLLLPSAEAREHCATEIATLGFALLERFAAPDAPEHAFGLVVGREEPSVELPPLHRAVLSLVTLVEAQGGLHHRWEAAPSPNAPARPAGDDDDTDGDDDEDAA